jgi:hypothetical protein
MSDEFKYPELRRTDFSTEGEECCTFEDAYAAMVPLQKRIAELEAQLASGQESLSDEQITSACLSRDHSFGLMDANKRALMIFSAREWERAFAKEKP